MSYVVRYLNLGGHLSGESVRGISTDYRILDRVENQGVDGWKQDVVAVRQHQAFAPLLQAARDGKPRQDFVVAAQAVSATGLEDPLVIEVGCGSGYYGEILPLLLEHPIRYVGIDYATTMTTVAHRAYPDLWLAVGDACSLPFRQSSCDILFSGTSLMHIINYRQAIEESVRVSRGWCIFHTVPVMVHRATTLLCKRAYGEPVTEVVFNQSELETLLHQLGLTVQKQYQSIPYDLSAIVDEETWTVTYLCHKRNGSDL